jgi:molecular chaperone IbpA
LGAAFHSSIYFNHSLLKEKLMALYGQDPFSIGFDRITEKLEKSAKHELKIQETKYPPLNVIKVDDYNYTVELAVAGFGENDLTITLADQVLSIVGKKKESTASLKYLWQGIAERAFERKFTLADTVVIKKADLKDGILVIALENVIPEEKKPIKIAINESQTANVQSDKGNGKVYESESDTNSKPDITGFGPFEGGSPTVSPEGGNNPVLSDRRSEGSLGGQPAGDLAGGRSGSFRTESGGYRDVGESVTPTNYWDDLG